MNQHFPDPAARRQAAASILARAHAGERIADGEALVLSDCTDLASLMTTAAAIRDAGRGDTISYSRKVFIPLTHLCRDSCHYCTFAHPPRRGTRAYMTLEEVLAVAEAGRRAGCREALFTLGDKPELRYRAAREELAALGHETTLGYLHAVAERVFAETGLLPHLNPGVMDEAEIRRLKPVSASMGLMLETASERFPAAEARISARPTSCPRRASRPSRRLVGPASPSPPASSSASARPASSASRHCSPSVRSTRRTATSRRSSSRTSAPRPARAWRRRRSRTSTTSCGPSPSRASFSARK